MHIGWHKINLLGMFFYDVTGILLQRDTCYHPSSVADLTFTPAFTKVHCALQCVDTCVAIAINTVDSYTPLLQCATLATHQIPTTPSPTSCNDASATVEIFKDVLLFSPIQTTQSTTLQTTGPMSTTEESTTEESTNEESTTEESSTTTAASSTSQESTATPGQCHCLSNNGRASDFTTAENTCEAIGGQLPETSTVSENQVIWNLAATTGANWTGYVWMGATRRHDDVFRWSPSGSLVEAEVWDSGQPGTLSGEDCTQLINMYTLKMHDMQCSFPWPNHVNVVCDVTTCPGC